MNHDHPPGTREWVYESIIRSVPFVNTSRRVALAVQFLGFELAVLLLGWYHGLPRAAIAGTIGVVVSVAGSVFMLRLSTNFRRETEPRQYLDLLLDSGIELVLGLVSFILLIVYAFVYNPQRGGPQLVTDLLGAQPPLLFVTVLLFIGWDVAYRIGVGWWACVTGFWRTVRFGDGLSRETRRRFARLDALTIVFASLQLIVVPVLSGHLILQAAVLGHVVAVGGVSGVSIALLRRRH